MGSGVSMSEDVEQYTFSSISKYVGMYKIGGNPGFCIKFANKPNWFHRTMMKICLGWEWKDTP
jgi:hypothetical protein